MGEPNKMVKAIWKQSEYFVLGRNESCLILSKSAIRGAETFFIPYGDWIGVEYQRDLIKLPKPQGDVQSLECTSNGGSQQVQSSIPKEAIDDPLKYLEKEDKGLNPRNVIFAL